MLLIEWDDTLVLGVQEIDEHHRKLVEILNRCYLALMLNEHRHELEGIVKELDAYTRYHFGTEEELMAQAGLAQAPAHAEAHRSFISALEDFRGRLEAGESFVAMDVLMFLKDWLVEHIQKVDRALADLVVGKVGR